MKKRIIGLSTCGEKDLSLKGFQLYADNGIGAMEISVSADAHKQLDCAALRHNAAETGVQLWSYHLPFEPFEANDISSLNERIRRISIDLQKGLLEKAAALGCRKAVIHPSGEPLDEAERAARLEQAKKSLSVLAAFAAGAGLQLAVENLPRTCLGRNAGRFYHYFRPMSGSVSALTPIICWARVRSFFYIDVPAGSSPFMSRTMITAMSATGCPAKVRLTGRLSPVCWRPPGTGVLGSMRSALKRRPPLPATEP